MYNPTWIYCILITHMIKVIHYKYNPTWIHCTSFILCEFIKVFNKTKLFKNKTFKIKIFNIKYIISIKQNYIYYIEYSHITLRGTVKINHYL